MCAFHRGSFVKPFVLSIQEVVNHWELLLIIVIWSPVGAKTMHDAVNCGVPDGRDFLLFRHSNGNEPVTQRQESCAIKAVTSLFFSQGPTEAILLSGTRGLLAGRRVFRVADDVSGGRTAFHQADAVFTFSVTGYPAETHASRQ